MKKHLRSIWQLNAYAIFLHRMSNLSVNIFLEMKLQDHGLKVNQEGDSNGSNSEVVDNSSASIAARTMGKHKI